MEFAQRVFCSFGNGQVAVIFSVFNLNIAGRKLGVPVTVVGKSDRKS